MVEVDETHDPPSSYVVKFTGGGADDFPSVKTVRSKDVSRLGSLRGVSKLVDCGGGGCKLDPGLKAPTGVQSNHNLMD